jgi:hypothetical protein
MTKWRMRNIEGQQYSAVESRIKHAQYGLYNLGLKVAGFLPWALGIGVGLKVISDLWSGNYDGSIPIQAQHSFTDNLPWKVDFYQSLAMGGTAIAFGELYSWLKPQLYGKSKQYNQVAVAASIENAQIRDNERAEDLEEEAMTPARSSRTRAI